VPEYLASHAAIILQRADTGFLHRKGEKSREETRVPVLAMVVALVAVWRKAGRLSRFGELHGIYT